MYFLKTFNPRIPPDVEGAQNNLVKICTESIETEILLIDAFKVMFMSLLLLKRFEPSIIY